MHDVDILLDDPAPPPPRRVPAAAAPGWRRWWTGLPRSVRSPMWPRALGGLVALALLVGYHQVLRDAVRQGELLRLSAANRAEAVWRCNTLTRAAVRASCLAQIETPRRARDAAPPPNTAALSLASSGS